METPIEHILSSFEGVTFWHFIPFLIVTIPVIVISILRRGRPQEYTWKGAKGWTPSLGAILANTPPEKIKDVAKRMGLSDAEIEELKGQIEGESEDP